MFGERIKKLRSEKFSQTELADILKVDRTTISKWETNIAEPSFEALNKLASLFNVSIDYLLGREIPKENTTQEDIPDFAYALYKEVEDLDEEERQIIINLAKGLKERKKP